MRKLCLFFVVMFCHASDVESDQLPSHLHLSCSIDSSISEVQLIPSEQHRRSLFDAVANNNVTMLRDLYNINVSRGMRDDNHMTLLMFAAKHNHPACVSFLLQFESKLRDHIGRTAMMFAASSGCDKCVSALLEREKCFFDKLGKTALTYAAEGGYSDVVRILAPHENRLCIISSFRHILHVNRDIYYDELLKSYGDVGDATHDVLQLSPTRLFGLCMRSKTALMHAAERGHADAARILCKYELGETCPAYFFRTALMMASKMGHAHCVQVLCDESLQALASPLRMVSRRSELGLQDYPYLRSALMYAASFGHFDVIRLLCKYEHDLADSSGLRVMDYAKKYDRVHGGNECESCVLQCLRAM